MDDLLEDNTRNLTKYIFKLYIPFSNNDLEEVMKRSGFDHEEYSVIQNGVSCDGVGLSYDKECDPPGLKFYLQVRHEEYNEGMESLSTLVKRIIEPNADSLLY